MKRCTTDTVVIGGIVEPLDGYGTDQMRRDWNCGDLDRSDVAFYVSTFVLVLASLSLLLTFAFCELLASLRTARERGRMHKAAPNHFGRQGTALRGNYGECSAPPG